MNRARCFEVAPLTWPAVVTCCTAAAGRFVTSNRRNQSSRWIVFGALHRSSCWLFPGYSSYDIFMPLEETPDMVLFSTAHVTVVFPSSLSFLLSPLRTRPLYARKKHTHATDSKFWVDGGRPPGEGADHVLERMRALDALVRRSISDAHSSNGPYLARLSAVYGQPPLDVKVGRRKPVDW